MAGLEAAETDGAEAARAEARAASWMVATRPGTRGGETDRVTRNPCMTLSPADAQDEIRFYAPPLTC